MTLPFGEAITGKEAASPTTPLGALSEFYRAFNGRDLALMSQNWLPTEEASMDNPLGGIKRGWNEIRPVYERLFHGAATVTVEFFDYTLHETPDALLAVGRERGTLESPDATLELKIRTSRWFRRVNGRWRQLHHHGSIDDAELLARYQAAVR
ncbi:MAG TPA: nuclear transport factor 2 family protein [Gammaproteobacteria bacterium]|nr:nuclear transport factor 2 family protein [Gammaproteobacteria bacterium]